jgi:hypothetical protein
MARRERMRSLAAAIAFVLSLSVGIAVAGMPNDDENDYEGRMKKDEETYFGFDLSNDGKTVKGITAHLFYRCESGKKGSITVETKGGLKVKDGAFEGKTTGESKGLAIYQTAGKLKDEGKANGTLEAKLRLGGGDLCTARNDGEWNAKKGRDIDAPNPL